MLKGSGGAQEADQIRITKAEEISVHIRQLEAYTDMVSKR